MANKAWNIVGKFWNPRAPEPEKIETAKRIAAELERQKVSACVAAEIQHTLDRRIRGVSMIEAIGHAWRKEHGFGRPYSKANYRGRGSYNGQAVGENKSKAELRRREKSVFARIRQRLSRRGKTAAPKIRRQEGRKQ